MRPCFSASLIHSSRQDSPTHHFGTTKMRVWSTPMYGPHGQSTISVKFAAQNHKIIGYTSEKRTQRIWVYSNDATGHSPHNSHFSWTVPTAQHFKTKPTSLPSRRVQTCIERNPPEQHRDGGRGGGGN